MKIIYSLLATICILSNVQALDANHEKESDKQFHFGPVPSEEDNAKKDGE